MPISHVWFDCDDTMYVQPPELKAEIRRTICTEIALRTSRSLEEITQEYPARLHEFRTNTLAMGSYGIPKPEAQEIYNRPDIPSYVKPDPRLADMIKQIKDLGILVSVFTNNKRSTLIGILRNLGLNIDDFRRLMTAEEVEPKPSEEGYKEIVECSDVALRELMFVGDRMEADIIPARKHGMNTFLIKRDESSHSFDPSTRTHHYVRGSVYEVIDAVREINDSGQSRNKGQSG
ncbi:MAG TPA: HAD family hydrolase [Candidatus Nanoarchaeia archaeon]|nr:HAD family hydrolase [Candidatus Nanoarchaeia archaeon]